MIENNRILNIQVVVYMGKDLSLTGARFSSALEFPE